MKRRRVVKTISISAIGVALGTGISIYGNENKSNRKKSKNMWSNKLTETLGIKYPIIQGPFGGGLSSIELASTVSNLGGLGSFGAQPLSAEQIIETNNAICKLTDKPYAINLWVSDRDERLVTFKETEYEKLKIIFKPYFDELKVEMPEMPTNLGVKYEDQVHAVLKAKPPVFSFVYGIPSKEILAECKNSNIKTIGTATTVEEAIAVEKAGVDVVVATGFEAGGHRVSFLRSAEESLMGTFSLIPQVADNLKIPFVAAGGIADGRGIAAALTLGANGVQIGTAFLATKQSNASDLHKQKIFSEDAKYTTLTKAFTGRLSRGIHSKIALETKDFEKDFAPYPMQSLFMSKLRTEAIKQNRSDLFTFWAGQSSPLVRHHESEKLFLDLIKHTEEIWKK